LLVTARARWADELCSNGFIVLRGAVAPEVVRACVQLIEHELRARSVEPREPATWTEPVVRFVCPEGPEFAAELPASVFERPRAFATGRAGDVYLCHPFLVHRATWPHTGIGPRIVAQPEIGLREPFALREGPDVCAVERAILAGLSR
jgi:hypothetical protein